MPAIAQTCFIDLPAARSHRGVHGLI